MNSPPNAADSSPFANRIRWLYASHAGLFLFCFLPGTLDVHTSYDATRLGFLLAEASLLAMLAAYGPRSISTRWISAVAAFVAMLLSIDQLSPPRENGAFALLLPIFTVTLVGALALRCKGQGLCYYHLAEPLPPAEPLRTTIRQVLVGSALLVAAAAAVNLSPRALYATELLSIAMFTTLFFSTPFLALWAALGSGDPRLRSIPLLLVVASVSVVPDRYATTAREPAWFYPMALFMQAAVLLETLWIVRSCRYRLGPAIAVGEQARLAETPGDPLTSPWRTFWTWIRPKFSLLRCLPVPIWLLLGLFVAVDFHLADNVFNYDADLVLTTFYIWLIAQAGVLAIVCGLANVRWVSRIVLAGIGMMVLLRLEHRTFEDFAMEPFITITTSLVFGVMYVTCMAIRYRGCALQRFDASHPLPPAEPLRFSIAQIIVLTTLVAVLFASWTWYEQIEEPNVLLVITILSFNFLPGPLLALWAALEPSKLPARCLFTLLAGTAPAILPNTYLDLANDPSGLWTWPYWTGLNTSIILASLLVVRWCGYRLVSTTPVVPVS